MKHLSRVIAIICLCPAVVFADRITVHNKTPYDVYLGMYYLKDNQAQRVGEIKVLENDSSLSIERPERKFLYDRELVFHPDAQRLAGTLTGDDLERLRAKNIGSLKGDVFYISQYEGRFSAHTSLEWNIVQKAYGKTRKEILERLSAVQENPYKNTPAHVRVGNELAKEERAYLESRMPKVQKSLEQLLGRPLQGKYIPKIALVCSGGGYRAMLYSTGALVGSQKSGLLDSYTYLVGLSGSTWAIGSWMTLGGSLESFQSYIVDRVKNGLTKVSKSDAALISDMLVTKYMFGQPINLVDLYGGLLANSLFYAQGNLKQQVGLSTQAKRIVNGALPMPIYTAIRGDTTATENQWYEFTPYEIGASWLSMYVPSWSFGRRFRNGVSVNDAPEQSFGCLMATYGLAIGITIERLLQESDLINKMGPAGAIVNYMVTDYTQKRPLSANYLNYTRGMPSSPIAKDREIRIVDAGIGFNLPYPPISGQRLQRKIDIIIFIDASGGKIPDELVKTEKFAHDQGLKFPRIDYQGIDRRAVTIFKDEKDSEIPVVIYVPRIVDTALLTREKDNTSFTSYLSYLQGFDIEKCISQEDCNTFNFNYSERQAQSLISLGAFNVHAELARIKEVIGWVIDKKS